MLIRTAETDDIDTIVKYNAAMALETEGLTLDPAVLTPGVRGLMEKPEYGFYLVAEDNFEVVAQTLITYEWSDWRNAPFWWIQSVYVAPSHRGRKLFSALHKELESRAREAGACGLRLYVERENTKALEVYSHLQYQETHYKLLEKLFKPDFSQS